MTGELNKVEVGRGGRGREGFLCNGMGDEWDE